MLEKLKEGIYRVRIPFENIYTSSFFLVENNEAIILDSGSNDEDAEKYIIPTAEKLNLNIKYLVSSHTHSDHHGGINALKNAFPNAKPLMLADNSITDGKVLLGRFKAINLKGHSDDSLGVLDIKTKTLLSCDSLQLYGVDRFKTYVSNKTEYFATLEKVSKLDLDTIIASHEYEPMGSVADNEHINTYLQKCIEAIKYMECT